MVAGSKPGWSSSGHLLFILIFLWELTSPTLFPPRRSMKLTGPLLPKEQTHDLSKVWWIVEMVTTVPHDRPCIHTILQYEFCSCSHQELEFFSTPLESGLALRLAFANRMWQMWHWKFWACAFRDLEYFYSTLAFSFNSELTNSHHLAGGWEPIWSRNKLYWRDQPLTNNRAKEDVTI